MNSFPEVSATIPALRVYVGLLRQMILRPREFFRSYAESHNTIAPLFLLLASGIFYAFACLFTYTCPQPYVALGIFFVNAVGTPLLASGMGYLATEIIFGRQVLFWQVFGVYAYASAAALLLAWAPYLLLLVEIWRWWLIGVGLIIVCGLKRWQAVAIVFITIGLMISGYAGVMGQFV